MEGNGLSYKTNGRHKFHRRSGERFSDNYDSSHPYTLLDTSLGGHDYNTRRKQKGLLPSTYNRLVLKQRSLTNVLRKAYNWLRLLNLIPPELRNFTAEQMNKIVRNINEVYVIDNKDLFELFF